MRYQLTSTQSILNYFDVVNSLETIVSLANNETSLKEACAEYAQQVNDNEPLDEDQFDAYFDVELATDAYYNAVQEELKESASDIWNLYSNKCGDVKYLRDYQHEDYGDVRVLLFDDCEITIHTSEEEDTIVDLKQLA